MNTVTCLSWIAKGFTNINNKKNIYCEDKFKSLINAKSTSLASNNKSIKINKSKSEKQPNEIISLSEADRKLISDYNLDDYSDDDNLSDDDDDDHNRDNISYAVNKSAKNISNFSDLCTFTDNRKDPYLKETKKKKTSKNPSESSSGTSSSEEDEEQFHPGTNDRVVVAGRAQHSDDFFSLETWVYKGAEDPSDREQTFYCHHDNILPSCPLSLEWIGSGYGPSESSVEYVSHPNNLAVVGCMDGSIAAWDINEANAIEPMLEFRRGSNNSNREAAHSDAVLNMSFNRTNDVLLASCSADRTISLWDVSQIHNRSPQLLETLEGLHRKAVNCIEWHTFEGKLLLSGSSDKTARLFDCRCEGRGVEGRRWSFTGSVEKILWNEYNPFQFLAGTSGGRIFLNDVRMETRPIFRLDAHIKHSITGLFLIEPPVLRSEATKLLITSAQNASVKVWDFDHLTAVSRSAGEVDCRDNVVCRKVVNDNGGNNGSGKNGKKYTNNGKTNLSLASHDDGYVDGTNSSSSHTTSVKIKFYKEEEEGGTEDFVGDAVPELIGSEGRSNSGTTTLTTTTTDKSSDNSVITDDRNKNTTAPCSSKLRKKIKIPGVEVKGDRISSIVPMASRTYKLGQLFSIVPCLDHRKVGSLEKKKNGGKRNNSSISDNLNCDNLEASRTGSDELKHYNENMKISNELNEDESKCDSFNNRSDLNRVVDRDALVFCVGGETELKLVDLAKLKGLERFSKRRDHEEGGTEGGVEGRAGGVEGSRSTKSDHEGGVEGGGVEGSSSEEIKKKLINGRRSSIKRGKNAFKGINVDDGKSNSKKEKKEKINKKKF